MSDDLSEKLGRIADRIADARARERAAVERSNKVTSGIPDMNAWMRGQLTPSRTFQLDDPELGNKINGEIREATGRGIVGDGENDADDAA